MYYIPDHGNTETYLIQGADVNLQSNNPAVGQIESMNTNQAPEYFVDPGMYLPTATNYGYYCTGFQSSGEWDDHLRVFGLDGSDVYAGAQAENIPYVCYTPSFGYGDSAYNPYNPYIPGAVMGVDGSYVGTQPYYTVSPYQNPAASSSGYIPVLVQSRPDVVASSSTDPMIDRGSSATNTISAAGMKNTNTAASARFSFTPGKSVSSQANPFMRASESTRINSGTSKPPLTHRTNAGRNYEASSFLPQGGNSSISSQIMDNVSRRKVVPSQNESNVPMPIDGFFNAYDPNTAGRAVMDGCWPKFYDSKIANDTNGAPDMLAEQNRGPRTDKSRHEIIVRAYTTKAGEINSQGNIVISTNEYNKDDFRVDYANAKFFVIKSYSEDDVHKSIKYNVWSSTTNGNRKLNSGYEDAQLLASGKPRGCPVFLYFSVNASGQFCGVAEMVGPVDFSKDMDFWQQDKWSGSFPIKWHIIKDVPNNNFRHIILENNEHRPVTNSRDTQEIMYNQGMEMLKIFKNYAAKTSLLDDFMYYEDRQRIMLEERARLLGKANFTPFEPYGKINCVGLSKEGQREPPLNYHNGSRRMTESVTEQVSLSSDVNGAVNDNMLSNLRIGSLSINPKQTEQRVSMGAPPVSSGPTRIGNGAADNIVTVGTVPLKVNGLDRSSGVLTVGSIPLDPKALQPEKRIVSGKGGSQK